MTSRDIRGLEPSGRNLNPQTPLFQDQFPGGVLLTPVGPQGRVVPGEDHRRGPPKTLAGGRLVAGNRPWVAGRRARFRCWLLALSGFPTAPRSPVPLLPESAGGWKRRRPGC